MIKNRLNKNQWLLLSVFLILIMTLTPGNGEIAGKYLDKLAHFAAFLFLAMNICRKYQGSKLLTDALLWGIVLGFFTELIQQIIPGRNMDIYDGLADTLGLMTGYYVCKQKALFSKSA